MHAVNSAHCASASWAMDTKQRKFAWPSDAKPPSFDSSSPSHVGTKWTCRKKTMPPSAAILSSVWPACSSAPAAMRTTHKDRPFEAANLATLVSKASHAPTKRTGIEAHALENVRSKSHSSTSPRTCETRRPRPKTALSGLSAKRRASLSSAFRSCSAPGSCRAWGSSKYAAHFSEAQSTWSQTSARAAKAAFFAAVSKFARRRHVSGGNHAPTSGVMARGSPASRGDKSASTSQSPSVSEQAATANKESTVRSSLAKVPWSTKSKKKRVTEEA
mmetsp:Transcript_24951/g.83844  ORF Transcript_24951/g.83844 Transcript_24951/m.83844 type:complete len:274 (-) Transcript_24951:3741-4562(-)